MCSKTRIMEYICIIKDVIIHLTDCYSFTSHYSAIFERITLYIICCLPVDIVLPSGLQGTIIPGHEEYAT